MSLILDEHREYLSDRARIDAFARAVTLMVRPGDVVLDLGSGTGILGLMACRAGAERVYALEYGPIVGLARQIAQANGFGDRVHFIKELSTRAVLPEPVDLVLTDQIGRFGFEAGLLEYLPDARRRFLKPGGRTIPSGVDLWLAPVEHAAQWRRVSFWEIGRPVSISPRRAPSQAAPAIRCGWNRGISWARPGSCRPSTSRPTIRRRWRARSRAVLREPASSTASAAGSPPCSRRRSV